MSIKNRFQNWFYLDDDEEIKSEQPQQREAQKQQQSQQQQQKPQKTVKNQQRNARKPQQVEEQKSARVVSLQSVQKSSKVILAEPRVYAEAQDISEHLKNKRAVVVNLQKIDKAQGLRIVDFLSGVIDAIDGDIKRIGSDIFLCVPDNVEVTGAITDYFEQ